LVPWAVAGVALLALVLAVVLPRAGRGAREAPFAGPAPAPSAAAAPDISSMTPRERADRLFNRVMTAVGNGDTAQAAQFLPMALQAHQLVPDLDSDGRYHYGVLLLVAGDGPGARAQADSILARDSTHLFGLFTAAQAARGMGEREEALRLFRSFLAAYPREVGRDLPEYQDHRNAFPAMREEAERETGTRVQP
ncbi:MAG TPA: hypothetical protein VFX98_18435, partial [Longimicrobiaceae bacterium]|nr:hypothetical protein [Longimicrobiaceae bacterium]